MRWVLACWALPMGIFWGWFFLSFNDINFGYLMLSRQVHDIYFQLIGQQLGLDPAAIPALVARTCVIDTLFLLALWAFRRRREIAGWLRAARDRYLGAESSPSA